MGEFLKVFLRGIIVTLLLPFIIVFLALYTVYCVIVFLIMLIRNIIVFFMGGSTQKMKQDEEAIKLLTTQTQTEQDMAATLAGLMHSAIQQNPEAVQAMAQQQIAANKMAAQQPQQVNPVPEITPTSQTSGETSDIIFDEGEVK